MFIAWQPDVYLLRWTDGQILEATRVLTIEVVYCPHKSSSAFLIHSVWWLWMVWGYLLLVVESQSEDDTGC
jgi:hypothetical protein